uniref:La ribonucleoprotein 4Aa n=1 Tax=Cyprinus carpio TaxID=7962 RepID=A0A8C1X2Y0_CYPCA
MNSLHCLLLFQVTAKGAGLNPNAKVWQEIPATQSEAPVDGTVASPWSQNNTAEDNSVGKQYTPGFSTPEDNSTTGTVVGVVNGMDPPDQSFPEQPVSEETLRESLKKELEFCFSRENLSKDLYLISQMDSDQFVPIWTIASMEGIKVLTTDTDLILDVLRSSPMVQVDEKGEKVRPNHKRCIIILREVPETTPVEEVEALFKNDNCPKVISVEFAHNNNWYITFQSDTDAQQAYKYLREEVKTFQGKPIMARIKAINTFFAKNGYRSLDCSVYPQQSHTQSQYSSPLFMQPVYSPQQQYPLYGIVPPTWTPSPTPYFETPLAPFPNSGFVNGFSSPGHYKTGSTSLNLSRPFNRMFYKFVLIFCFRRTTYRGTRRRREDDRTTRPVPLSQVKVPSPKFDLAASNFPPLPGCSASPQGEPVLENRLSDVVRGLNREKKVEPLVFKETSVISAPVAAVPPTPAPTAHGPKPQASSATPAATPQSNIAPSSTPALEPRKLSYAEVCQRPPKDPPPPASTSSPNNASTQPLRELRVNKVEEQQPPSSPANKQERPQEMGGNCKAREGRPARDSQGFSRGSGPPRTSAGGFKLREQQRRPPFGHRGSPQGGSRHTGKEQNIPPISPK